MQTLSQKEETRSPSVTARLKQWEQLIDAGRDSRRSSIGSAKSDNHSSGQSRRNSLNAKQDGPETSQTPLADGAISPLPDLTNLKAFLPIETEEVQEDQDSEISNKKGSVSQSVSTLYQQGQQPIVIHSKLLLMPSKTGSRMSSVQNSREGSPISRSRGDSPGARVTTPNLPLWPEPRPRRARSPAHSNGSQNREASAPEPDEDSGDPNHPVNDAHDLERTAAEISDGDVLRDQQEMIKAMLRSRKSAMSLQQLPDTISVPDELAQAIPFFGANPVDAALSRSSVEPHATSLTNTSPLAKPPAGPLKKKVVRALIPESIHPSLSPESNRPISSHTASLSSASVAPPSKSTHPADSCTQIKPTSAPGGAAVRQILDPSRSLASTQRPSTAVGQQAFNRLQHVDNLQFSGNTEVGASTRSVDEAECPDSSQEASTCPPALAPADAFSEHQTHEEGSNQASLGSQQRKPTGGAHKSRLNLSTSQGNITDYDLSDLQFFDIPLQNHADSVPLNSLMAADQTTTPSLPPSQAQQPVAHGARALETFSARGAIIEDAEHYDIPLQDSDAVKEDLRISRSMRSSGADGGVTTSELLSDGSELDSKFLTSQTEKGLRETDEDPTMDLSSSAGSSFADDVEVSGSVEELGEQAAFQWVSEDKTRTTSSLTDSPVASPSSQSLKRRKSANAFETLAEDLSGIQFSVDLVHAPAGETEVYIPQDDPERHNSGDSVPIAVWDPMAVREPPSAKPQHHRMTVSSEDSDFVDQIHSPSITSVTSPATTESVNSIFSRSFSSEVNATFVSSPTLYGGPLLRIASQSAAALQVFKSRRRHSIPADLKLAGYQVVDPLDCSEQVVPSMHHLGSDNFAHQGEMESVEEHEDSEIRKELEDVKEVEESERQEDSEEQHQIEGQAAQETMLLSDSQDSLENQQQDEGLNEKKDLLEVCTPTCTEGKQDSANRTMYTVGDADSQESAAEASGEKNADESTPDRSLGAASPEVTGIDNPEITSTSGSEKLAHLFEEIPAEHEEKEPAEAAQQDLQSEWSWESDEDRDEESNPAGAASTEREREVNFTLVAAWCTAMGPVTSAVLLQYATLEVGMSEQENPADLQEKKAPTRPQRARPARSPAAFQKPKETVKQLKSDKSARVVRLKVEVEYSSTL